MNYTLLHRVLLCPTLPVFVNSRTYTPTIARLHCSAVVAPISRRACHTELLWCICVCHPPRASLSDRRTHTDWIHSWTRLIAILVSHTLFYKSTRLLIHPTVKPSNCTHERPVQAGNTRLLSQFLSEKKLLWNRMSSCLKVRVKTNE